MGDGTLCVGDHELRGALEELKHGADQLTQTLLGARRPDALQEGRYRGDGIAHRRPTDAR